MTEKDTADKLKARLSQWQSYVEQSAGNFTAAAPVEPETAPPATAGVPPRAAAEETVAAEPVQAVVDGTRLEAAIPPSPAVEVIPAETVIAQCEAQIADLQAAVVREREQARRLAETLTHGARAHRSGPSASPRHGPTAPFDPDTYARQRRSLLLFCILLLLAGLSTLLAVFLHR